MSRTVIFGKECRERPKKERKKQLTHRRLSRAVVFTVTSWRDPGSVRTRSRRTRMAETGTKSRDEESSIGGKFGAL